MKPEYLLIVGIYLGFAIAEALGGGFIRRPGQTRADAFVELVSTITLFGLTQPAILLTSAALCGWLMPGMAGAWAQLPIVAQVALFLVADDMMQYWWHRLSHSVPWLYSLHRPHHNAAYMSVRIVYRNNLFYYALMPSLWLSGVLIYLGLGWVYAGYAVVKMLVIIAAHSHLPWDAPLYRVRALSPLMWLVERTISTPATHWAHHGKHKADGVTNYKGNFGNLLFFWDVLFGTAKITRRYPGAIGVEGMNDVGATEQLLWPLVRSAPPAAVATPKPAR
ncbi:sterol desaturase family protein [Sphingomonas sp. GlSt437]|uniref:sterol desaturase family protein n=1 Tax=Sphingomonas sp. GlSt437 TaxID=3389970 RepID=UPI003A8BD8C5